jgi:hypothetical protein
MPKKAPRNNPKGRELRTVHNAGAGAAALLQRIKARAGVALAGDQAAGPAAPFAGNPELGKLPAELALHVTATLAKEGELVVFTDSAAWAARLKLWLGEQATIPSGRRLTVKIRQPGRNKG